MPQQTNLMRKLLMASVAAFGATGGLAMAQTPANPSQGQLAAPYGAGPAANNNNNAWGIANTLSGSTAAGMVSSIYPPNVDTVPTPGTIVIRLNGRVFAFVTDNYTSADHVGAFKVNPLGISSYLRLYPGFDGQTANGIRYGASAEIRENFPSGTFPGSLTGSSPAAATLTTQPTAAATSPSANSSGETLFVRRAFVYIASNQVGLLRLGQGDGVIGLFDNCVFTSQCWDAGNGVLNSDSQGTSVQNPLAVPFVWLAQAGAEYANNKIVYLSPQVYGFDFGVQYAPSMGNAFQDSGVGVGCTVAGPTCINVTSGTDPTRWYNQVGVGLRFQRTFGIVDAKAYGFYETAAKENVPGLAFGTTLPVAARSTANVRYDNLSFHMFGAALTSSNFTLAADYIGGDIGSSAQLALKPTGGVNMNAWTIGLTYAKGAYTAGVTAGWINGQGDPRLVGISQRREFEIATGGNYRLAPGVQLVAEYLYAQRHQGDFNFNTNALGSTGGARTNSFIAGMVMNW